MKKEVLNNSFVFYATNLEVIETLEETDKELANDFMKAIIEYGIYGEYENTNPIIKVLMVQAGFGIDKAKDRYATAVENGKKGGRPKIDLDNDVLSVMRDRGMSYQEIADKLGVSKSTIQRRFKEIDSALVSNGVKTQNLNVNVNDNENVNINDNENDNEINNNNINNINIGDFAASQQNPATSLATQVSSVRQVEAVAADKVITIDCSDMRDSYYHLYKYLAMYQPALASFVVNGVAFCRSNKERIDKAIEICNTCGFTINFNDTANRTAPQTPHRI